MPLKRFVADLKQAFAVATTLGVETVLDSSPLNKTYALCRHNIGDRNDDASSRVLKLSTFSDELERKLTCAPIRDVVLGHCCGACGAGKLDWHP